MITFDLPPAVLLGLLVSVVLPLGVGFVTTRVTDAGVKAILLAGLAAITGLGTELLNAVTHGVQYNLGHGLVFFLGSFLIAVGVHYGFYKNTGVTDAVQDSGVKPRGQ